MALSAGFRLGPYEIVAPLGAGGMGEVYRARDVRLGRSVAIKILPDEYAADPDRIARFHREAQLLASLNHPNIAIIHGLEDRALVMELVEGPTLADRIAQGTMTLEETLAIAAQIADALEAAHERGVVHRDLKPANIKVTSDGHVKVLDFGLAKLIEPGGPDGGGALTMSPTVSVHGTYAGVILGTAAYMSPEQARGKPVDRRADIWAFGCVLYEMLTGRPAFDVGDTVSDAIAAVLKNDPDWSALPASVPPPIRTLLRRCLQKNAQKRLPHIGLVRLEIEDPSPMPAGGGPVTAARRQRLAWSIAFAALAAAFAIGAWMYSRPSAEARRVIRTSILPPPNLSWGTSASVVPGTRFALSPDGRHLAFIASDDSTPAQIWVRRLDALSAQPLAGTERASDVKWSPDSDMLVFVASQTLRKISASGGPAVALASPASTWGLAWGAGDRILFTRPDGGPLFAVPADGGDAIPVTTLDASAGDVRHAHPFFLPDGRRFLFNAIGSSTDPNDARAVYVGSLDANDPPRQIIAGGSNAQYAAGYLFFARERTVLAQPFDVDTLLLSGAAEPVAEEVQVGGQTGSSAAYSVSPLGDLVYQGGSSAVLSQLTWFDRGGKLIDGVGGPADQMGPELSPDGTQAVVSVADPTRPAGRDLWVYDLRRGLRTRVTFESGPELFAAWWPDGNSLAFNSRRQQRFAIYRRHASGTGSEEELLTADVDLEPEALSPDGRFLAYHTSGLGRSDIWILPLSPGSKPFAFANSPFNEARPQFSPDGRWLAYVSLQSGQWEVYVSPFPSGTGRWQVSADGGHFPRWRGDGRELYYVSPTNVLTAVAVDGSGQAFKVDRVQRLFELRPRRTPFQGFYQGIYAPSADGQRFLVNVLADADNAAPLTFVENWPALLRSP